MRHLYQLAGLYGIQTAYYDVNRRRRQASPESLLAALRSLGAPLINFRDVPSAWRERQKSLWQRIIEPIIVVNNGESVTTELRLPVENAESKIECRINLETGEHLRWEWYGSDFETLRAVTVEGNRYVVKRLDLPSGLPWGYHHLTLEVPGKQEQSTIISCPVETYTLAEKTQERSFGVFLPLYALRSGQNWGSGDFKDLRNLIEWMAEMGGSVVATLPLLSAFHNGQSEPSPYLPVSRLFWDELYVDITSVPELKLCQPAQSILESPSFQEAVQALRNATLVDYQRQMGLKKKVLREMSRCLFDGEPGRLDELRHFRKDNPAVEDYAGFRAVCDKYQSSWQTWPKLPRDGVIAENDYSIEDKQYHLYAQWLTHQQMENVSKRSKEKNVRLYLDLPIGVSPDGYDVWRRRENFISDASAGAPPDSVFTRGQNWTFPPLHPERIREQGYRYLIDCLCHHMRQAGILRIDHVMGLHRLFIIPKDMEAAQGVYVRYRPEELYAVLALESHRHKTAIVGEDLGTVPKYVRPAMNRHKLNNMYVLHYELASDFQKGLPPVPSNSVASLNTHDMPPFASFWQGLDIKERERIGLLDKKGAEQEKNRLPLMKKALTRFLRDRGWLRGSASVFTVLNACLSFLAASRAGIVLINLEDLWLEKQPQNVPSTLKEYPNWRRKARYTLEQFCQLPQVVDTLRVVNELRKRSKNH